MQCSVEEVLQAADMLSEKGVTAFFPAIMTDDTDIIKERINIICETTDGFKISEKDLELRGSGEFLGDKQSGIPDFKLGNIIRDKEIMRKAKDEMRTILKDESSKETFYI